MPNKQAGTEQFTAPKLVPEAEFKEIKAESVKIYAYANRVLTKACAEQEIKSWGFALFDQHGCLLRLYGPAGYLEWCRERGICVRSCWDRASFGRNAISLGLEQRCPLLSAGEENESPLLRSASIFFDPLLLERSENSADYELLGGIAAISPV